MQLSEALARTFVRLGASPLFGVIGEGNLFVVDHYRAIGGRYVAAAHEASAVLMANGYAQASGEVGYATVTHGPGLTNTVTALVEASRNRSPIVLLVGDVAADDPHNVQNIEHATVVAGTGAAFMSVGSAADACEALERAAETALSRRGPVVLNIPVDLYVQEAEPIVPSAPRAALSGRPERDDPMAGNARIGEALAARIGAARRPLLLAGAGAASGRAKAALEGLAERTGARLATTLKAKDLFRGHPADIGVCGGYSLDRTRRIIQAADLVVAWGAGLNDWTTQGDLLFGDVDVIQIDNDSEAVGRFRAVRAAYVGDAAELAESTVTAWVSLGLEPGGFGAFEPDAADPLPSHPEADAAEILAALDAAVPAERTLAMDAGRFLHAANRVLSNPALGGYVHSLNFGVIGIGMANAIGAWFAHPDRPVLHVAGDGGFMLGGVGEFHTAVREGVDLIAVILNDGAYGAEHIQFENRALPASTSQMAWPDFALVAEAFGAQGLTIRRSEDAAALPTLIARRRGPVLIDVRLDPSHLNDFARVVAHAPAIS